MKIDYFICKHIATSSTWQVGFICEIFLDEGMRVLFHWVSIWTMQNDTGNRDKLRLYDCCQTSEEKLARVGDTWIGDKKGAERAFFNFAKSFATIEKHCCGSRAQHIRSMLYIRCPIRQIWIFVTIYLAWWWNRQIGHTGLLLLESGRSFFAFLRIT